MRALRLARTGAPLEAVELPDPVPAAGEVVVRVRAAGICHSDAHYRAGRSASLRPPIILGHEVAGEVVATGRGVTSHRTGDRVCLHYLVTCGACEHCAAGRESWCPEARMLGHHRDGGYAERIAVPARNAVLLPDAIPFAHGAAMMCSSATALHALRRGRLAKGETVAVVGCGGLGISAVQLARALGAAEVVAVDLDDAKLAVAARHGARTVRAERGDPDAAAAAVRASTGGRGVDVAVEMVGAPETITLTVRTLAVHGRAVVAGLTRTPVALDTYRDLLGPEGELIGSNDHTLGELHELIAFAESGALDLADVVTRTVPLEADAVNGVLDALEGFRAPLRTVIAP
jgi:2-desacetyl-2-hydroxyethyl bacteriochlorophyllide A dehydrogenase